MSDNCRLNPLYLLEYLVIIVVFFFLKTAGLEVIDGLNMGFK